MRAHAQDGDRGRPGAASPRTPGVAIAGDLAAGYDTNPELASPPEQRRLPSGEGEIAPSAFGELRAVGAVALAGRHAFWARAGAAFTGRAYTGGAGTILEERLRLESGARGERWLASLSLEGARHDREAADDSAWLARTQLRLALALSDLVSIGGAGTASLRAYDADQTDVDVGGGIDVTLALDPLELTAGVDATRRESTVISAERAELVPWAQVALTSDHVGAEVLYAAFVRRFDATRRDGAEHLVRARVEVRPWETLGLFARFEHGVARAEELGLEYDRTEVAAGITARFEVRAPAPPPTALEDERQGPATLVAGGARFRFRLPEATAVQVIGTFNDWDPTRGELRPAGGGWFEGTLPADPGRHRYHLVVDGAPRRPPGAEAYVEDDFGGEDAVLTVPDPAER